MASTPTQDRNGNQTWQDHHYLLPHEVLQQIWESSDHSLLDTGGLDPISLSQLQKIKRDLGTEEVVALSLWLDGVPYNWDRHESLQCFTFGFPGFKEKPWSSLRECCNMTCTWQAALSALMQVGCGLKCHSSDKQPCKPSCPDNWGVAWLIESSSAALKTTKQLSFGHLPAT